MNKEEIFTPYKHPFVQRGLNCLHIDGPGQGTRNIRKIRVTADNYERAGVAAIDWLARRPEVDADKIVVSGFSFGSFWGMRIAALDPRVKAVAPAAAFYGPKAAGFEPASPRFKQEFMYMAGIHDEAEVDNVPDAMTPAAAAPQEPRPALPAGGGD